MSWIPVKYAIISLNFLKTRAIKLSLLLPWYLKMTQLWYLPTRAWCSSRTIFWVMQCPQASELRTHKSVSALVESTMTWKMWDWIPITTPCLKCSATGALATILRKKPLPGLGSYSQKFINCQRTDYM